MRPVAIITGTSRGIGFELAAKFSDSGYAVYGVSRYKNKCGKYVPVECDVRDSSSVENAINFVIEREGKIDVLVNNAGVAPVNNGRRFTINEIDNEQWYNTLQTNLFGSFYFCREAVKHMKIQKNGRIINISSASVHLGGIVSGVDYISSKSALIGLTKGLAYELGTYGIRVNCIVPGRIKTDMLTDVHDLDCWVNQSVPLQRLGKPEDIAELAMFLASDGASYITGSAIDCNGGWVMR